MIIREVEFNYIVVMLNINLSITECARIKVNPQVDNLQYWKGQLLSITSSRKSDMKSR